MAEAIERNIRAFRWGQNAPSRPRRGTIAPPSTPESPPNHPAVRRRGTIAPPSTPVTSPHPAVPRNALVRVSTETQTNNKPNAAERKPKPNETAREPNESARKPNAAERKPKPNETASKPNAAASKPNAAARKPNAAARKPRGSHHEAVRRFKKEYIEHRGVAKKQQSVLNRAIENLDERLPNSTMKNVMISNYATIAPSNSSFIRRLSARMSKNSKPINARATNTKAGGTMTSAGGAGGTSAGGAGGTSAGGSVTFNPTIKVNVPAATQALPPAERAALNNAGGFARAANNVINAGGPATVRRAIRALKSNNGSINLAAANTGIKKKVFKAVAKLGPTPIKAERALRAVTKVNNASSLRAPRRRSVSRAPRNNNVRAPRRTVSRAPRYNNVRAPRYNNVRAPRNFSGLSEFRLGKVLKTLKRDELAPLVLSSVVHRGDKRVLKKQTVGAMRRGLKAAILGTPFARIAESHAKKQVLSPRVRR